MSARTNSILARTAYVAALVGSFMVASGCGRPAPQVEVEGNRPVITWIIGPVHELRVHRNDAAGNREETIWAISCLDAPCITSPTNLGAVPNDAVEDTAFDGVLLPAEYEVQVVTWNADGTRQIDGNFFFVEERIDVEVEQVPSAENPVVDLLREFIDVGDD